MRLFLGIAASHVSYLSVRLATQHSLNHDTFLTASTHDKHRNPMHSTYHSLIRRIFEILLDPSSLIKLSSEWIPTDFLVSSLHLSGNTKMTGVEAVGFVLGVLPLMISAAEHYEDVFRPFKRYRRFAAELDQYQQQLGTQKTIFRNECRLLLATLTNRLTAKEMLRECKHASWEDPDLDKKFSIQLADSGAACKNIINLIHGKLKEVEERTESFGSVIQQSIPVTPQIRLQVFH